MSRIEGRENTDHQLRWISEVYNHRHLHVVDEVLDVDMSIRGLADVREGRLIGPGGFHAFLESFITGFPDLRCTPRLILSDGDWTAVLAEYSGGHLGRWVGLPGSGAPMRCGAGTFCRWRDGRAVDGYNILDRLELITQIAGGFVGYPASAPSAIYPDLGRVSAGLVADSRRNRMNLLRWCDDAWGNGNERAIREMCAPEAKHHGLCAPGVTVRHSGEMIELVRYVRTAFPDLTYRPVLDLACGEWTAALCVLNGTHIGRWCGLLGTGAQVSFPVMTFIRWRRGRIIESVNIWDRFALLFDILTAAPGSTAPGSGSAVVGVLHDLMWRVAGVPRTDDTIFSGSPIPGVQEPST